jgi:putative inorganic carbon (hco3(-)) transporter
MRPLRLAANLGVGGIVVLLAALAAGGTVERYAVVAAGVSIAVAGALFVWHADPAYTFCAALLLSSFEGNWPALGVPGFLSPDRWLLVGGIIAVAGRAPCCRDRPPIRPRTLYWVMAAAIVYVAVSAAKAGTLTDKHAYLKIVDSVGITPFGVFAVAPAAFRTARQRGILVKALVILGAYYGLTAFLETVGPKALVWPRYILDPNYGIHAGRARGPFAEAVTFGTGMFVCAIGAIIAFMSWRSRLARVAAAAVLTLCTLGIFFTLTRSVWIGAGIGLLCFMLAVARLRRYVLPAAAVLALVVAIAAVAVPSIAAQASSRANDQETVWDRQNLDTAALNMFSAKPLTGFGWQTFVGRSPDYFQLNPNFPLPVGPEIVHNVWLGYLAELGLVGTTLIVLALLMGVGSALLLRAPPRARIWQAALVAYGACYLVVSNFVTPEVFPTLVLWLLAGVVWAAAEEGTLPVSAWRDRMDVARPITAAT